VRLLVFDDPALQHRYEWLADDADVHDAMRALARQAYRRHRQELPDAKLAEQLRAHATIDARPYVPPAGS
jgi:hypothetical protein